MTDIVERLRTKHVYGAFEIEQQRQEAAGEIERLRAALKVLLEEAENFSVSGVYFDEECMGHKGPALARAALYDPLPPAERP